MVWGMADRRSGRKTVAARAHAPCRAPKRKALRARRGRGPALALVHPKDLVEERAQIAPSSGYYSNDVHVAYFARGEPVPASYKKIGLDLSKRVTKAKWGK